MTVFWVFEVLELKVTPKALLVQERVLSFSLTSLFTETYWLPPDGVSTVRSVQL